MWTARSSSARFIYISVIIKLGLCRAWRATYTLLPRKPLMCLLIYLHGSRMESPNRNIWTSLAHEISRPSYHCRPALLHPSPLMHRTRRDSHCRLWRCLYYLPRSCVSMTLRYCFNSYSLFLLCWLWAPCPFWCLCVDVLREDWARAGREESGTLRAIDLTCSR